MPAFLNILTATTGIVSIDPDIPPEAFISFGPDMSTPGTTTNVNIGVGLSEYDPNQANARYSALHGDPQPNGAHGIDTAKGVVTAGGVVSPGSAEIQNKRDCGYDINWTNLDAGKRVPVLAIGSNTATAKAGSFVLPSGSGSHAVTGLGFEPQLVILMHSGFPTADTDSTDTALFALGASDGTNQFATCCATGFTLTSAEARLMRNNAVLLEIDAGGGGGWRASLTSLDSDGFTINRDTALPANKYVIYLAIRDDIGGFEVGSLDQGDTSVSLSTITDKPDGLMFFSSVTPTFGTSADGASYAVGLASRGPHDEIDQAATSGATQDNAPTSVTRRRYQEDDCITLIDYAGTTLGEAQISGWSPGGFGLNWSTDDGTNNKIAYVAMRVGDDSARCNFALGRFYATLV